MFAVGDRVVVTVKDDCFGLAGTVGRVYSDSTFGIVLDKYAHPDEDGPRYHFFSDEIEKVEQA
ncbi:hypothetical protein ACFWNC_14735 [Streptomyces sp. NPDC058369]|uniref:hypothetical protein n=1 Tax=Streptomyces sp. NPDC058369 TaxID=3346462 RepID=UPI00364C0A03